MKVPTNPRLWDMFVARAKQKYRNWPCPAANHWVHEHYVMAGGRFVSSGHPKDKVDKDTLINKKEHKKAAKARREADKEKS